MNKGDLTGLVLMDLQKAVGMVNYERLLHKLKLGAIEENGDLVEPKLGSDIGNIVTWCDDNTMAINYNEIEVMILATYNK